MRCLLILLFFLIGSIEACHPRMDPVTKPTEPSATSTQAATVTTTTVTTTTTEATTTTTEGPKTCDADWTTLNRENGVWCVKAEDLSANTYEEAEALCAASDAKISSVETEEELGILLNLGVERYMVVGADHSAGCECTTGVECTASATCNLQTAFNWNDGFVAGRTVFETADSSVNYGDILLIYPSPTPYLTSPLMSSLTISAVSVACGKEGTVSLLSR